MKIALIFLPLIAFSSDSNAQFGTQTENIVADAADAIIAGDADALMAMRFNAYDPNGEEMSVDRLLDHIAQCGIVNENETSEQISTHEIYFNCNNREELSFEPIKRGRCDDDILVIRITRATSPDIYASLSYKRLATNECPLPKLPSQ